MIIMLGDAVRGLQVIGNSSGFSVGIWFLWRSCGIFGRVEMARLLWERIMLFMEVPLSHHLH